MHYSQRLEQALDSVVLTSDDLLDFYKGDQVREQFEIVEDEIATLATEKSRTK
jgi:hypothetical protein